MFKFIKLILMECHYDKNFCNKLYIFTNKYYTNYYGLNSPTSEKLTLMNISNFKLKEFFLFNNNGLLIMNYNFSKLFESKNQKNKEESLIQHSLISLRKLNQINEKSNFIKYTIYLNNYKLIYIFQNNQILIGKFPKDLNNYYCYLCLKFIYISLINFKFDINEKISILNSKTGKSNSNIKILVHQKYKKIDDIFQNQNNLNINENEKKLVCSYNNDDSSEFQNKTFSFSFNDYLEIKIYEKYFLRYLVLHFNKIFELISHREELFLHNINLKNVYYIDLKKQEIIFDFNKVNNHKFKNFKFYKQEKIFKHCLLIAKKLEIEYKNHLRSHSELEYIQILTENFGKFECTSTYPRYSFYIKYLPVLSGIAVIHVYAQKKLSRQTEYNSLNTNSTLNQKFPLNKNNLKIIYQNYYYEFLTLILNNNNNIDDNLKYYEPEKVYNIQKFFFEFFIASTKQNDIYYYLQKNRVPKYFNKDILNAINSVPASILQEKSIESIFFQINLKLESLFLKKFLNDTNKNNSSFKEKKNQKELNDISKIFEIEEDFILLDLFKDLVKKGPNCLVKFDSYNNIKNSPIISMQDTNSIFPPSPIKTDNSKDILLIKDNGNNKSPKLNICNKKDLKKRVSEKSSLKSGISDYNFFSSELDDSSFKINGLSRKISNIYENNNEIYNRKEFLNHRKSSFFEEIDSNYILFLNNKNNNKEYDNLRRVMTFENGIKCVKYSALKLGKNYEKDIICKKMELFGFSGSFGMVDEIKKLK